QPRRRSPTCLQVTSPPTRRTGTCCSRCGGGRGIMGPRGEPARWVEHEMRIGIVCPYSFAVAGGVQNHVRELAQTLLCSGHEVSVLAPGEPDGGEHPEFVSPAGRALAVRFNGSVARLRFGPVAYARVRQWLRTGDFDVLHLHEPTVPSLSMLALAVTHGPVVATFHLSTARSRMLTAFTPVLRPLF